VSEKLRGLKRKQLYQCANFRRHALRNIGHRQYRYNEGEFTARSLFSEQSQPSDEPNDAPDSQQSWLFIRSRAELPLCPCGPR
jgi:hypothetical protein